MNSEQESNPAVQGRQAAAEKLRAQLLHDIGRFNDESKKHKAIHRRAEIIVIAASALTTIISGIGLALDGRQHQIQFIILVLSTISSAVTSWAASRRARDLWQHEREVFYALKDILRELEFRLSTRPLELSELEELFRRSGAVLGSSTAKWSRILERKLPEPTDASSPGERLPT